MNQIPPNPTIVTISYADTYENEDDLLIGKRIKAAIATSQWAQEQWCREDVLTKIEYYIKNGTILNDIPLSDIVRTVNKYLMERNFLGLDAYIIGVSHCRNILPILTVLRSSFACRELLYSWDMLLKRARDICATDGLDEASILTGLIDNDK